MAIEWVDTGPERVVILPCGGGFIRPAGDVGDRMWLGIYCSYDEPDMGTAHCQHIESDDEAAPAMLRHFEGEKALCEERLFKINMTLSILKESTGC